MLPNTLTMLIALTAAISLPTSAVDAEVSTPGSGKHLFILSGQSNMVGMNPDVSFTPTVTKAFGQDRVLVVKNAHSGQSIRSWCKSNLSWGRSCGHRTRVNT